MSNITPLILHARFWFVSETFPLSWLHFIAHSFERSEYDVAVSMIVRVCLVCIDGKSNYMHAEANNIFVSVIHTHFRHSHFLHSATFWVFTKFHAHSTMYTTDMLLLYEAYVIDFIHRVFHSLMQTNLAVLWVDPLWKPQSNSFLSKPPCPSMTDEQEHTMRS